MVIGPVRRRAMQAANEAYAAASGGRNLVADLADGFGLKAVVDWDAATEQIKAALTGKLKGKHPFPVTFTVDPTVDNDDDDAAELYK